MLATLRNRNFALVWTAGLISMTGDWLLSIGLPIYVLTLTNSVLLTSIMFMVSFLPNLLFGSFAGVLVDRWDRKRTMVIASALQVLAILPLLLVTSADRAWIVFASGFAESTLGLFFTPAESALLPLLVEKERLASANALSGVNRNLARLLGPALGGLIIAMWGLDGVILGDAISFGLAALLIAPVRTPGRVAPSEPSENTDGMAPKRGILRELAEGLGIVAHSRPVAVLFAIAALTGVGEGLFGILLVVWTKRVLGGGALELGWMMSGQAVGGLLGGLIVAGLIAPRVRPARLLGVCLLIFGATDIAIVDAPLIAPPYLPPSPVPQITSSLVLLVVALFILVGIPGIGGQTGQTTLLQQAVPNTHLGRVMSLYFGLFSLALLVGMAIAGLLGDQLGSILLLNGQGSLYMCSGLLAILFLWGWRSAHAPAAETATVAEVERIAAGQEALEPAPNSAAFDA
jgi:MFS family permease